MVENPPVNAGDVDSIPDLGRNPEEEMATYTNILAWKIPCKRSQITSFLW